MPEFTYDENESKAYFKKLDDYIKKEVYSVDGCLKCGKKDSCKKASGNEIFPICPSVGDFYSLKRDGNPFRVLIFGMEVGKLREWKKGEHMCERTSHIGNLESFNPHMKGTLYTLQKLFGKKIDEKYLTLTMDIKDINETSKKVRILKAFALSNSILCTTAKQKARKNCVEHFKKTIKILEPQIIILQGNKAAVSFNKAFNCELSLDTVHKNQNVLVLPLNHPSARGYRGYRNAERAQAYLKPIISILLEKYKEIWGE